MTIKAWPIGERPRDKLLEGGARTLSDAELLGVLLGSGIRGKSAVAVARELLIVHGNLHALATAPRRTVCATAGVGTASYATFQAALEFGRRVQSCQFKSKISLESPDDTCRYLAACLDAYEHEVFACLFLDHRHRVIRFEEMFRGTVDGAIVYPREILKRALALNAAAIIVAHNHPSGVAEPSAADRALTRKLKQSCALVDIRLLDHVVIGHGETVSFAARRWL